MLIERSQLVIGLIAIVVILFGTVFAVFSTGGLLVRGHTVIADFEDADGLSDGDFIYSSGVRVGQVTAVDIVDANDPNADPCLGGGDEAPASCVRVTLKIDHDGVPDDSIVEITLQNALGRRQVRLIPGDSGTFFRDGSRVGIAQTSTPTDLPELGDKSAELLGGLETSRLNNLAVSLSEILDGKEQEVSDLLDALDTVTAVIADRRDELARVLEEATTLVEAAADKDQDIVTIIDRFGSTLDLLANRRTEIARLLDSTADATTISADLVEDRQAQIDRILTELRTDLEIIDARQVEIADFFAVLGVGFEGYAGIGWHGTVDNADWGNVFTTQIGPLGYGGLLDCGSVSDLVLGALFGPDPNCVAAASSGLSGVASVDAARQTTNPSGHAPRLTDDGVVEYPGIAAWFSLGGPR